MVIKLKRPIDADNPDFFLGMESDNYPPDPSKWSIFPLSGAGEISLHAPNGKGHVTIPKADFDAIVRWYTKPQAATGEK